MKATIGKYPKSGERKVSIVIDPQDVWSLDDTLSLLIHPLLVALKEAKGGSPPVANADVPESLRSGDDSDVGNSESWHSKWAWVLDEMIFAFAPGGEESPVKTCDRRANGRRLFAKYFHALWT